MVGFHSQLGFLEYFYYLWSTLNHLAVHKFTQIHTQICVVEFIMWLCLTDMGITVAQWRASVGSWTRRNIPTAAGAVCKESLASPWFQLLVLVALLVIGGIEMNPGPNQVSVISEYKFCSTLLYLYQNYYKNLISFGNC